MKCTREESQSVSPVCAYGIGPTLNLFRGGSSIFDNDVSTSQDLGSELCRSEIFRTFPRYHAMTVLSSRILCFGFQDRFQHGRSSSFPRPAECDALGNIPQASRKTAGTCFCQSEAKRYPGNRGNSPRQGNYHINS